MQLTCGRRGSFSIVLGVPHAPNAKTVRRFLRRLMEKDTYLISQIAWWVGGENCADDVTHKEYAARIIELVRKHDKRLTKRAADDANALNWTCLSCGGVILHESNCPAIPHRR